MGSIDELEPRVATLEAEMVVIRREVADARALAAGADHDVSDCRSALQAQTGVLNALRQTQLEQSEVLKQHSKILEQHSKILKQHGQKIDQLNGRVNQLDRKVDQLTVTMYHMRDGHGAQLNQLVGMLQHLIDREDEGAADAA